MSTATTWQYQGRTFGDTEIVTCPVCAASRHREILRRPDDLPIVACADCGMRFVNPQPTQDALVRFYASGYFEGGHDFFQGHDYFAQRELGIEEGDVTGWGDVRAIGVAGKRVLDLGCASGALLVLARANGASSVKGIELDAEIAQRGRSKHGIDIRVGDVFTLLAAETERFDIVCAFDLIEHVKKPAELFRTVAGVLADNGRFAFSVPNGDCLERWGTAWTGVTENMEHLSYFRHGDLLRLAGSARLKVERLATRGFPLPLKTYSREAMARGRLSRFVREPGVAVANAMARIRVKALGRGAEHEIAAVLAKT